MKGENPSSDKPNKPNHFFQEGSFIDRATDFIHKHQLNLKILSSLMLITLLAGSIKPGPINAQGSHPIDENNENIPVITEPYLLPEGIYSPFSLEPDLELKALLKALNFTGEGVTIVLLDTAVKDPVKYNIIETKSYFNPAYNELKESKGPEHGTLDAKAMSDFANKAEIISLAVCTEGICSRLAIESALVNAKEICNTKTCILVMPFGRYTFEKPEDLSYCKLLKDINGVKIGSAGNNGEPITDGERTFVPGGCPGVIAVGSINPDGEKADFSNYNDKLPVNIGTLEEGEKYKAKVLFGIEGKVCVSEDEKTICMNGTSPSAAKVAGILALKLQKEPNVTLVELEELADQIGIREAGAPLTQSQILDLLATHVVYLPAVTTR